LELIPILSTILMVATLVTVLFAFFSYVAFRYRERKKPGAGPARSAGNERRFFRRYHLPPEPASPRGVKSLAS